MSAAAAGFLGLERSGDGWVMEVGPGTANPAAALYGGAPVAASIVAAEAELDGPVRWATTRFLRGAQVGERLTVRVEIDVAGRRTTHARVVGTGEAGPVFDTVLVAGAGAPDGLSGQWVTMPDVPGPDGLETAVVADRGSAFGIVRMFTADGTLVASATQTAVVRSAVQPIDPYPA